ncbi:proteasome-type protease [Sabulicella glaciei]|uniref:Proteasome-type protease n=1 Tax=Sabulicella glaciei TaxID=2984948 RepID=A0ABT3NQU0_9PROT|nr:proteasome-type protease [Roseococcus sp. MDT2-1-1]MCW8084529.1 proteasome-type protease [Roseococcus sp. MDT2-1-1]
MTYCVGLCVDEGLVMLSDTRTNAGLDNISSFSKMFVAEVPGERALVMMTAGNLAVTQTVWNLLQQGVWLGGAQHQLDTVPDMFHAAQLVGAAVRQVKQMDGAALLAQGISFECSILLGGQILDGPPRLFLVYAAGNFIEATEDTPFLQIGEHKYGKPILDRVLNMKTSLSEGVALTLISMDSTVRSNLSVGLPLDLAVIRRDALRISFRKRITEEDPYYRAIREGWAGALRDAYLSLPRPDFPVG